MQRRDPRLLEKLYERACQIQDRRANGHFLPVLEAAALRGSIESSLMLADFSRAGRNMADVGSELWLLRKAARKGSSIAAQNLAMVCFNRRDLAGYRHWLRLSARLGDGNDFAELKRFEVRLPHNAARAIRRQRPERRMK